MDDTESTQTRTNPGRFSMVSNEKVRLNFSNMKENINSLILKASDTLLISCVHLPGVYNYDL